MATSTDPGHFFQTEAALTDAARRKHKAQNASGAPLRLKSKLLALLTDRTHPSAVFVAESAGPVRRIDLAGPSMPHREYRGPTAPSTSLALDARGASLFAGCWDRSVWSWDARSGTPGRRFTGPADFVKCVACARLARPDGGGGETDVLVAGGADAGVTVWDAASGATLHVIRGHGRGVLSLAVQPVLNVGGEDEHMPPPSSFVLWSAGSDRSILRHRVSIAAVTPVPFSKADATNATSSTVAGDADDGEQALQVHETSVNSIALYGAHADGSDSASLMLLTASSDKTAARSLPVTATVSSSGAGTTQGVGDAWKAAQTMPHPDFVRAIVAFPSHAHALDTGFLVATACRDEEVRIWDGEDQGTAEPLFTLSGHFDEVSGLDVAVVGGEDVLVSVGLDGTLRRWPASRAGFEKMRRDEQTSVAQEAAGLAGNGNKTTGESVLTAEEEAELAELMSYDDD